MTFVQAGTTKERLVLAAAATSDANGLISIRLGPGPLGYVWQGSVTVTNAPSGALFTASVASTAWGQWAGPTNFGPVQLWGNETLVVAGVGLQPSTQYSMLFFGVSMPEHLADPVPPVAPTSVVSVENATKLLDGVIYTSAVLGGPGVTVRVPALTRRLTLVVYNISMGGTDNPNLFVKGVTTNVIYFRQINLYTDLGSSNLVGKVYYIAVEPSIDAEYHIITAGSFSGQIQLWVLASSTNPLVETNDYSPLEVIPGHDSSTGNTITFNTSGSPVGPFKSFNAVGMAGGSANNLIILAPGVGNAIYLQSLQVNEFGGAGVSFANFKTTAGALVAGIIITAANDWKTIAFPGGLQLPTNSALLCDCGAAGLTAIATFTTGPAL